MKVLFEKTRDATRAVMYHYVRSLDKRLPYFRYLSIENFEKQVQWLSNSVNLSSRESFLRACSSGKKWSGTVLTFDDGFLDHYRYVLPVLRKYNLWGIFFPVTGPLTNGDLLDVHKVHLILGKLGSKKALDELENIIKSEAMMISTDNNIVKNTYLRQSGDNASIAFKRILNYGISGSRRSEVLDKLISVSIGEEEASFATTYYLSKSHLREMVSEGMVIGGHTVTHPILSTLNEQEQTREIKESISLLRTFTEGDIDLFAYPYGIKNSFNSVTERILRDNRILMSFVDDPRDITDLDFLHYRYALPRYDCNQLPFGQSSRG